MKYLKYFEETPAYEAYKNGSDYILPNVSLIGEDIVMYNPYKETRVVCTYNINSTTLIPQVCNDPTLFTSMEVNGVLQDSVTMEYPFPTFGEYTIKFELADPTSIGKDAFDNCTSLTSVVIPESVTSIEMGAFNYCRGLTDVHIGSRVTSIGMMAFSGCTNLTSIVIPDSVTTIGDRAFINCTSLNEITCNAITAPTISSGTFHNVKQGGILKVPAGSDYSTWMSTSNNYLGKYNWTIEYI